MMSATVDFRPRNPALHAALRAYAEDALGLLDDFLAAGGEVSHTQQDSWERRGDVFVRERRDAPLWADLARDLRESMAARGAWRAAMHALREDRIVAPQLDTMVGLGLHRRRITAHETLEGLLVHLAGDDIEALRFDEARFQRAYASLEQAFHQPDIAFEALAPLRNVRAEAGEVFLGPQLRLAALEDEEVVALLRAAPAEVAEGVVVDPPRFAVKVAYHLPKQVPEGPGVAGPGAAQAQAEERADEVLRALTAFKAGRATRGAVVHRSTNWFLRDVAVAGPAPRAPGWGNTYALGRADAAQLARFWAVLQHPRVRGRKSLSVALRRFRDAAARGHPEDRLIDLLVTADALALNVTTDSSDRAEMLHRLALRTGSRLGEHRVRREFDRHIRAAQQVRDDVVHGVAPRVPPLPDGAPQTLEAFIDGTEDLLRHALQRAVALAAAPEADHQALDWERIATALPRTPTAR